MLKRLQNSLGDCINGRYGLVPRVGYYNLHAFHKNGMTSMITFEKPNEVISFLNAEIFRAYDVFLNLNFHLPMLRKRISYVQLKQGDVIGFLRKFNFSRFILVEK